MNTLLTEEQASEYLGKISVKTLQRWRIEGSELKFVKLGKAVRYRQQDLESFVNDNIRSSTTNA